MKDYDTTCGLVKGIKSESDETLDPAANLKEIQKTEEHVKYNMNVYLAKSRLPETISQMAQGLQL